MGRRVVKGDVLEDGDGIDPAVALTPLHVAGGVSFERVAKLKQVCFKIETYTIRSPPELAGGRYNHGGVIIFEKL